MTGWTSATNWEIRLPTPAGSIALSRQGKMLRLHPDHGSVEVLELAAPPDVAPKLADLNRDFAATAARYHHFSDNIPRRLKVTYLLIGIFVLQQIFFVVYKRIHGPFLEGLRFLNLDGLDRGRSLVARFLLLNGSLQIRLRRCKISWEPCVSD